MLLAIRMHDGNQCIIKQDDTRVEFPEIGTSLGMIVLTEEGRALVARIALPEIGKEVHHNVDAATGERDFTEDLKLTFKHIKSMIQTRIEQVLEVIIKVEKWQITQIVFFGNKFWTDETAFFESKFWAARIDSFKSGVLTAASNFLGFSPKTQEFQVTLLTALSDQVTYQFDKQTHTITCIDGGQEVLTQLAKKVEPAPPSPNLDEKYWKDMAVLLKEIKTKKNPEDAPVIVHQNAGSISNFMEAIKDSEIPLVILGKYLDSLLPIFGYYQFKKLPETLLCLISFSEQNTEFKNSFQSALKKYLPELAFLLSSAALNQLFEAFKGKKDYKKIVKNEMFEIVCRYVDSLCTRKISENPDDVIGVFNNLKEIDCNEFDQSFYESQMVVFFGKDDQKFRCNFTLWLFSNFQSTSTVLKKLDQAKITELVRLSIDVLGLNYSFLIKSKTLLELIAIMQFFCEKSKEGVCASLRGRKLDMFSKYELKYPFLMTAVEHQTIEGMIQMMRFLSEAPLGKGVLNDQVTCNNDMGSESFLSLLSQQRNIDGGFTEVLKVLTEILDYKLIRVMLENKRNGKTVLENLFECNKLEYLKTLRHLVEYVSRQLNTTNFLESAWVSASDPDPVDRMREFLMRISKGSKGSLMENLVGSNEKKKRETLAQFTEVNTGVAPVSFQEDSVSLTGVSGDLSKNNLNVSGIQKTIKAAQNLFFGDAPKTTYSKMIHDETQENAPLKIADHAKKVSLEATYKNFLSSLIIYGPPIVKVKDSLFTALLLFELKIPALAETSKSLVTLKTMTLDDMPEVVESTAPFQNQTLLNP